jgi:4-amino-4-deoxy-L-arabinose transferase-like glycosyltransferase
MVRQFAPAPSLPAGARAPAVRPWLVRHRASLLLLSGATTVVGAAMCWNLQGYPGRADDDEGTYVSRAWAMLYEHHLSNYTYFWDHPFFGWAQIAGWARLTDGFALNSRALMVGREFMLAVTLVSCVLLYLLARRLGMGRVSGAAAVLLFGLSPVAIWYHRMVSLDNLATAWALAAFVTAASRRRSLGAAVASAVCFAAATWSKETILLLLPALLWLLGQQVDRRIRKKYLLVFAVVYGGIVALYPLLAIIKGELVPGAGHVSLVSEISYQLASRQGTGSLLDVHSQTFTQARSWVELDPWLTLGGLAVAVAGLAIRRLRAIALAIAVQLAYMAKGGYVPYAYVTAIIPFAALLVPGVLDELWQRRSAGRARQLLTRLPVVIVALVFAVAVVPRWAGWLHSQAGINGFASEDAAVAWIARNVPARDIVVSDAYPWLDIKLRTRATPLYLWQIDDDPAVMHDLLPHGYKDISYLLLEPQSPLTFKALPGRPTLQAAIAHSVIVERYGDIDIYKVSTAEVPTAGHPRAVPPAAPGGVPEPR